ncbi:fasciclin-like arabinogalactan protein 21 [Heracleum sosnowskyi]|uniref:Fasciclin-like arabinogalactan protein 21 n=1 Tax=Heracleum sosnowskyi TaxID=360622 RepID=A0AAD8J5P4_9APIA|nr:fasciclin-like arabinogalactan protein 21 [Heracleum sosnowskyi]
MESSSSSSSSSSCSRWWYALFYFAMSITLAIIITTSFHSTPNSATPTQSSIKHQLSLTATHVLKSHGFNVIAPLLHISPDLFLSSQQLTIFSIHDRAFSDSLVPSSALNPLLLYHIVPTKYTFQELLNMPQNSCLETLLRGKKTVVTRSSRRQRLVEINNVLISHPDLFVQGPVSIQGVLRPFASLSQDWDNLESPVCVSSLRQHHQRKLVPKNRIEWPRIIHLLRSKGYASFAMGLNSVIEGIIQDFKYLDSVTILAPPDLPFLASASPLLQRIVKFHMLPRRFSFTELTSLPEMASLRTLLDHKDLQITTSSCFSQIVAINGVEIASPDISASNKFVIHGISEVFPMEDEELSSVLG